MKKLNLALSRLFTRRTYNRITNPREDCCVRQNRISTIHDLRRICV